MDDDFIKIDITKDKTTTEQENNDPEQVSSGDLFVLEGEQGKYTHTLFRLSAIVMGYMVYRKGAEYDDNILKILGITTMCVDSFTFYKSIIAISDVGPSHK